MAGKSSRRRAYLRSLRKNVELGSSDCTKRAIIKKNLVGSLPGVGPFLSKISDFGFKPLGIVKLQKVPKLKIVRIETEIYGLGADFVIPVAQLWSNSSFCTCTSTFIPQYQSSYANIKLMNLSIKILPSCQVSERQGEWCLAFTPFLRLGDSKIHLSNYKNGTVPGFNTLCRLPGSVHGLASEPLEINYSTRSNTYLQMFHSEDVYVGAVRIAYQDTLRSKYSGFKSSEFAPVVILSGKLKSGVLSHFGTRSVDSKIWDNLQKTAMTACVSSGITTFTIINDQSYKCKDNDKNCLVSGNIRTSPRVTAGVEVECQY